MNDILKMPVPFSKMSDLSNLVVQANSVKTTILEEKYQKSLSSINNDKEEIKKEYEAVINSEVAEKKKVAIQDKYNEIENTYNNWSSSLSKDTPNLDSYVLTSKRTVDEYKKYIQEILAETDEQPTGFRRKSVRIIDCVPTAKKKIKTKEDIDAIVEYIREKLENELKKNDEINLD